MNSFETKKNVCKKSLGFLMVRINKSTESNPKKTRKPNNIVIKDTVYSLK